MLRNVPKMSLVLCLIFVLGCSTTKLLNLNAEPVPKPYHTAALTQKEVGEAIVKSLADRGWFITNSSDGVIDASITVKERYHASVKITYSATRYSINYADSRGLNYNDGKINRGYNRWVAYLNKSIQKNLNARITQSAVK